MFSFTQAGISGALWAVIMSMAVSMIYLTRLPQREVVLAIVFPMLISSLPKSAYFHVRPQVLFMAGFLTWVYSLLIKINTDVRMSLEDPANRPGVSAPAYGSMAVFFGMSIVAASYMYRGALNVDNKLS